MKALVTGGKGFIGGHIVERLAQEGHEVIVIDDESAPENANFYEVDDEKVFYYKMNILDRESHDLYENVDVVFHTAARSRIQPSFNNQRHTFENNVLGTQSVLEASRLHNVKRVIYSGSSSVYGDNAVHGAIAWHTELLDFKNPYALSKYQGEEICRLYTKMYGIDTIVLRYFNVYGPREPLKGMYAPVIGLFKKQVADGKPMTIVGTGTQKRDFTHVFDVVNANILAALKDFNGLDHVQKNGIHFTFNIGTGKNYSINEISQMIGEEKIYIDPRPGEAQITYVAPPCLERTKKLLGWEPTISLKDVILDY